MCFAPPSRVAGVGRGPTFWCLVRWGVWPGPVRLLGETGKRALDQHPVVSTVGCGGWEGGRPSLLLAAGFQQAESAGGLLYIQRVVSF